MITRFLFLSKNEEPVISQGNLELSSKKAFKSSLLTNLSTLKILDSVGFIETHKGSIRVNICVRKSSLY